uniref:Uncharacterized protein n=1 Tax=Meloidogyne hapla TaxID=6305 RepID=A0A1I8B5F2_MELHA
MKAQSLFSTKHKFALKEYASEILKICTKPGMLSKLENICPDLSVQEYFEIDKTQNKDEKIRILKEEKEDVVKMLASLFPKETISENDLIPKSEAINSTGSLTDKNNNLNKLTESFSKLSLGESEKSSDKGKKQAWVKSTDDSEIKMEDNKSFNENKEMTEQQINNG